MKKTLLGALFALSLAISAKSQAAYFADGWASTSTGFRDCANTLHANVKLAALTAPKINTTFTVSSTPGPPLPCIGIGYQGILYFGVPLATPVQLTGALNMNTATSIFHVDTATAIATIGIGGGYGVPIPNDPTLIGSTWLMQAVYVELTTATGAKRYTFSDAWSVTILP